MITEKKTRYFSSGFKIAIVISLIVLLASALLWANYAALTATPTQAQHATQTITSERQTATWQGIFLNNLRASWFLIVPVLGLAVFFFIWYNTATILGLESAYYNVNASLVVLLTLGVGALEIAAYIIAFAENLYIIYLAVANLGAIKRIKTQSWKTWITYALLLLIAAIVEAGLISRGL
ncbi:MAG TPA: stage II sporulation protein M [Candidatus Bathyarchaeia archaeon]|nr:stage II sporulation protein M [Candidatus Bathyarchaeia archaeon]